MEDRNGETHMQTDEARGGSTPNIVRWVLGISLLAAIVLLSIIWMTGAVMHDPAASDAGVNGAAAGESTDGIVSDNADEFESTSETGAVDANRIDNQTP